MPREVLKLTRETTYGVYASGGASIVVDLPGNNAWTVRAKPNMQPLRSAGANNLRTHLVSATADVAGKLTTAVRPSQTAFLLDLLAALTSGNCPDLPSFTADHGILLEDGSCTLNATRYLGCKFASGSFKLSQEGQGMMMMGDFDVVAKSSTPNLGGFSVPPLSSYPFAEDPWLFREAELTIGTERTDFDAFSLDVKNMLKPFGREGRFIRRLKNFGRDPSLTATLLFASLADREAYEAIEAKTCLVTFTRPYGSDGTKVLTLDFGDVNYFMSVDDTLALDDWHRQQVTLDNFLDGTAGTDLVVTYVDTPPTP